MIQILHQPTNKWINNFSKDWSFIHKQGYNIETINNQGIMTATKNGYIEIFQEVEE